MKRIHLYFIVVLFTVIVGSLFYFSRGSFRPMDNFGQSISEVDQCSLFNPDNEEIPGQTRLSVTTHHTGGSLRSVLNLAGSIARTTGEDIVTASRDFPILKIYTSNEHLEGNSHVLRRLDNVFIVESAVNASDVCFNDSVLVRDLLIKGSCRWSEVAIYIHPSYRITGKIGHLLSVQSKKKEIILYDRSTLVYFGVLCNCDARKNLSRTLKMQIERFKNVEKMEVNSLAGYMTDISFLRTDVDVDLIKLISFNIPKPTYPRVAGERTLALLVPSTSRGMSLSNGVHSLPIFKELIPTFISNIDEIAKFRIILYISYDDTDLFYNKTYNREALTNKTYAMFGGLGIKCETKYVETHDYEHKPVWHWNLLSQVAYFDGCDYLYQLNDDTRFQSVGPARLVHRLEKSPLGPNIGVAGPYDEYKPRFLLIFSMVHRSHISIFGNYYPPIFYNWYSDDWISNVYGGEGSFLEKKYNAANIQTDRYNRTELADIGKEARLGFLTAEVRRSCERINYYLKDKKDYGSVNCNLKWSIMKRPLHF